MSEEKETEKSLVSVLALNIKGQLGKVTTFFSEHNFNILRLVLSAADKDDKIHKIIAYIEGDRKKVNEMCERLLNVENVLKVTNFCNIITPNRIVFCEHFKPIIFWRVM